MIFKRKFFAISRRFSDRDASLVNLVCNMASHRFASIYKRDSYFLFSTVVRVIVLVVMVVVIVVVIVGVLAITVTLAIIKWWSLW